MSALVFRATVDEDVGGNKRVAAYYELFVDAFGKWESFTRRTATERPEEKRSGTFQELRAVEFYKLKAGVPELEMRLDTLGRSSKVTRPADPNFRINQLKVHLSLVYPFRWENSTGEPGAYTVDLDFQIGANSQVMKADSVLLRDLDSGKTYLDADGQTHFQMDECPISELSGAVPEQQPLLFRHYVTDPDKRAHVFFLDGFATFEREDHDNVGTGDVPIGKQDLSIFFSRQGNVTLLNYRRIARPKNGTILQVLDGAGESQPLRAADFTEQLVQFDMRQVIDVNVSGSAANYSRWRLTVGTLALEGAGRLLCRYWNNSIASRNRGALRSLQDARDLSLVPFLSPTGPPAQSTLKAVLETEIRALIFMDLIRPEHWDYASQTRVLPQQQTRLPVEATFTQLVTSEGSPLTLDYQLVVNGHWEEPTTIDALQERQPRFNFTLAGSIGPLVKPTASTTVRIGAFDLAFNPDQSPAPISDSPKLSLDFIDCRLVPDIVPGPGGWPDYRRGRLRLTVTGCLALADLAPGSQDPLPDEYRARQLAAVELFDFRSSPLLSPGAPIAPSGLAKRPSPLVFRRAKVVADPALLEIRELLAEEANRGLTMEIKRSPQAGAKLDAEQVVVLDTAPFVVAQVSFPRLTGSDLEEDVGGAIANWAESELEGSKWEIAGISAGFTLSLPTQGVGEAMEKGNSYGAVPRGALVDFRFAPPAKLKLLSSYYRQRYSEAPWNFRRVMGYPGQRVPGAGLLNLRMEALYGMSVFVEARQPLRLTEISARLGALAEVTDPEAVADLDAMLGSGKVGEAERIWSDRRASWSRTVDAYNTRLGILEPWAEGRPDSPIKLEDGVDFLLRSKADTADPIEPQAAGPGELGKLRGGATFGFESRNIYDNVREQPNSNDGLLSGVYLSALGAWAYQRASFDNKRTRIFSDTAMGRTSYYSVERVGRIGVFWNRAKHVIVYKRSNLPSAQFESEQDYHVGRPIVRKVEEYIEILEPIRRFPESGPTAMPRGFVRAAEFTQSRIPVNGKWGHDIQDGWTIPLWNANADPDLYPRPHLNLRLEGDPEGAVESVAGRLACPDQVIFYANTAKGFDDRTDLWPACLDVDYVDQAAPRVPAGDYLDGGDPDGRPLPPPAPVAHGYERVTFDLEPIAGIDLVHARAERPMTALMRNVTMMRAAVNREVVASKLATDLDKLGDLVGMVGEASRPGSAVLPIEQFMSDARKKIDDVIVQLGGKVLTDTLGADPAKWPFSHEKACAAVDTQVDDRFNALIETIDKAYAQVVEELLGVVRRYEPFDLDPASEIRESLRIETERAFTVLSLVVAPVETGLGSVRREGETAYQEASRAINNVAVDYDRFADSVMASLAELSSTADTDIAGARELLDKAKEQSGQVTQALRAAALKLANGRLAKWADELEKADAFIEKQIDEAKAVLTSATLISTHLPDIEKAIKVPGSTVAEKARAGLDAAWQVITDAQDSVEKGLRGVHGDLKTLVTSAVAEVDAILALPGDKWAEAFRNLLTAADGFGREQLKSVQDEVNLVRATAKAKASKICDKAFKTFEEWKKGLQKAAGKFVEGARAEIAKLADNLGLDDARRRLQDALAPVADGLSRLEGEVRRGLQQAGQMPSLQDPGTTLRLLRALGDAPVLPNLAFNVERVPYFFDDLEAAVRTSPMAALVDRAGKDLKALGLRLPTDRLLDRLVPAGLQNFDIGKLFPDLAGIQLDKLFKGFKPPLSGNDNVHVTQGFDKTNRTGWVHVDVDMPLEKSMDLLSIGPLQVKLLKGSFTAHTDLRAQIGGGVRRSADGKLSGDWELSFGGTPLVTFLDTAVTFDSEGHFDFNITPAKVHLAEVLKFLSDLVQSLGDPKNGFTLELIQDGGMPSGVLGTLDLPLPVMGGGAFSVSGLRLTAKFGLNVTFDKGPPDFAFIVGIGLGRKTRPFALTIAFLSGGGWLEADATYHPNDGSLDARVTLGMVAGASCEFSFGPAYGGVYIYFGILAEFNHKGHGGGGGLTVGIMLLIGGGVTLLGFVTINITLLLQATYNSSDGSMKATGTLTASVRICWCVTVNVSESVTYNLAGKGGGKKQTATHGAVAAPATSASADHYNQFE